MRHLQLLVRIIASDVTTAFFFSKNLFAIQFFFLSYNRFACKRLDQECENQTFLYSYTSILDDYIKITNLDLATFCLINLKKASKPYELFFKELYGKD